MQFTTEPQRNTILLEATMMSGQELRSKRAAAQIPADLISMRTGIDRGRLSRIERGLIIASVAESERLSEAVEHLVETKRLIDAYAASLGWPGRN